MTTSEYDIIKTINQGNYLPLYDFYRTYRNEFVNWSIKEFSATQEQAKDAFQEAMLDFYQNVISGKLSVLTCSLKTYLFQIGKHKILNIRKKEQRLTYHNDLQLIDGGETHLFMEEENKAYSQEQIRTAIANLPDDCQKVLRLHYFNEYDMESIARELNYKNADTAKSKKSVCMKRLIIELKKLSLVFVF